MLAFVAFVVLAAFARGAFAAGSSADGTGSPAITAGALRVARRRAGGIVTALSVSASIVWLSI